MEYSPSVDPEFLRVETVDEARATLSPAQEEHLGKAHGLFGFHANAAGDSGVLLKDDLANALQTVLDEKPSEEFLTNCIADFCESSNDGSCRVKLNEFSNMLTSGRAQPKSKGRHWVALSLAEAETIRRILHVRSQRFRAEEKLGTASLEKEVCAALRYSPINSTHVNSLTGGASNVAGANVNAGGLVLDSSLLWDRQLSNAGSALSPNISATKYEAIVAHSAFRFFDCDMHFVNRALNILVRELHGSVRERERFFNATIGCRRRMDRKWQDTPLARVFTVSDEWVMLKQKAQAVFVREALKARNLSLWEAFTAFDNDNNGLLSPAEFYGALIWLNVPNLTANDVVDFLEAADTNRDGVIDYKEYIDMIMPPGSAEAVEETDRIANAGDADDDDRPNSVIAKVEPFGGEQLREVIVQRRQTELLRLKEERAHLAAYKEALDIKVFEEELLQSKKRKGGANPLVSYITVTDAGETRQVDFKFSTNQQPLRLVPTGKSAFIPIFSGTAANRPVKPMDCPKKHGLFAANYSWLTCIICRGRGVQYVCKCWCGFYLCGACYDGDRRAKEADRVNPAMHPTFLKCYNGCSFTLQIPASNVREAVSDESEKVSVGAAAMASTHDDNLNYSVSMDIRIDKLPPKGHTLSLLRFTMPGSVPTRKKNNNNLYVDSDGRVLCAFVTDKRFPLLSNLHDMSITVPAPKVVEEKKEDLGDVAQVTPIPDAMSTADSEGHPFATSEPTVKIIRPVVIRPGTWHIVTVSVRPREGNMCSFIDGTLCHTFSGKIADINNLKLQHKLTVLGGGRQSEARGADIRRLVIHDQALGNECHGFEGSYISDRCSSSAISALPLDWLYLQLANDHPLIGGRAVRIQSIYRSFIVRRRSKKLAEAQSSAL